MKIISFILLFSIGFASLFAQEKSISGIVKDSLNKPLEGATIIASPLNTTYKIKYTTTDVSGAYTLTISGLSDYNFEISYLGYKDVSKTIRVSDTILQYNFTLQSADVSLDEILIDYKYKPIEKKKDTLTYNLKAFTNGNENKMEDVLEKLPGLQVDGNVIKVKGKTVTKLLVEGKSFFDGNTTLALENIPADVMAKIEIISDYSESELMRDLSDTEDLALNVVLKENKKKFSFGDIEAGVGLDNFYVLHPALFKYSPKSNISFIGDINNFNNSSLTFSDLIRLNGGVGNLLKNTNTSSNLFSYVTGDKERFESDTKFSSLNFYHEFNEKINIEGYGIYSDTDFVNKWESSREYISDNNVLETRDEFKDTENRSAVINLKANYNPTEKERWTYNVNILNNTSDSENNIASNATESNQFLITNDGSNTRFSHYLEGFKKISNAHTFGLAMYHSVTNSKADGNWLSNTVFLENFFPLINDSRYQINQVNKTKSQDLNVILKDYWIASTNYHLFYSLGYAYKNSSINTEESQILSDNSSVNFSENSDNFGNDFNFNLSDFHLGIGIKAKFGKTLITLQAKPHYYDFKLSQSAIRNTNVFIEPNLDVSYNLANEEDMDFTYNFSNKYLDERSYLKNIMLTGFSSVLQGNPELLDERAHNFSLGYSNYKSSDVFFLDALFDYSIRKPVRNTAIIQDGINQLSLPTLLNLPETNLGFSGQAGVLFKASSLEFSFALDWLKANQIINQIPIVIRSKEYDLSGKWLHKLSDKTHLNFKYEFKKSEVNTDDTSSFVENIMSLEFDSRFMKNVVFKTNIATHFIKDYDNETRQYTIPNAYLKYKKPNSKFSYMLALENLLDNGVRVTNAFNNNLLVSKRTFTLPRILMFKLQYKF